MDKQSVEALMHLGILLAQTNRPTQAEEKFAAALRHAPNDVFLLNNMGRLLLDQQLVAQAEVMFRKAMARDRNNATTLGHLGPAKARGQDFAGAVQWYRRALAIDEASDWIRHNLSLSLLAQGQFGKRGRSTKAGIPIVGRSAPFRRRNCRFPAGNGNRSLENRSWWCPSRDMAMKSCSCDMQQNCWIQVRPRSPGFASRRWRRYFHRLMAWRSSHSQLEWKYNVSIFWAMAMSLPDCFQTTLESIPSNGTPYLFAPVQAGHLIIPGDDTSYKIGLVWEGGKAMRNDQRSLPSFEPLLKLNRVEGIRLFSLQKGAAEDAAKHAAALGQIIRLGGLIDNFADTAVLIAQLDLVITVDTATAHLAGALGKPVWIMLPFVGTDWRWMHHSTLSPWYASARLFRQPRPDGDWSKVIEQIVKQLAAALISRTPRSTNAQ
jgi:Glycosyltransferase family 9 (heptosyltransferase)